MQCYIIRKQLIILLIYATILTLQINGKDRNGNEKDRNGNEKDRNGNGKDRNGNGNLVVGVVLI